MEDNRLRDKFGIKGVLCVLGNKKLKVPKVAERPGYRICSVCYVRPVQREVDRYVVRLKEKFVRNATDNVRREGSRKRLKGSVLQQPKAKFADVAPGWTERRLAI